MTQFSGIEPTATRAASVISVSGMASDEIAQLMIDRSGAAPVQQRHGADGQSTVTAVAVTIERRTLVERGDTEAMSRRAALVDGALWLVSQSPARSRIAAAPPLSLGEPRRPRHQHDAA
jgi:hypothetical protein